MNRHQSKAKHGNQKKQNYVGLRKLTINSSIDC